MKIDNQSVITGRRGAHGFTLIEVLIALVIMSIVAAIAYSSYRDRVRQTRRADATTAINEIANRLEKVYSSCLTYTTNLTAAMPGACGVSGLGYRTTSPDGHYDLRVTDADPGDGATDDIARGYRISATPRAGGLQVGDGYFALDSAGRREFDANNNNTTDANEFRWP